MPSALPAGTYALVRGSTRACLRVQDDTWHRHWWVSRGPLDFGSGPDEPVTLRPAPELPPDLDGFLAAGDQLPGRMALRYTWAWGRRTAQLPPEFAHALAQERELDGAHRRRDFDTGLLPLGGPGRPVGLVLTVEPVWGEGRSWWLLTAGAAMPLDLHCALQGSGPKLAEACDGALLALDAPVVEVLELELRSSAARADVPAP